MAIENAKTLNVRIRNKYDSYENWAASSLVLEAGEIALCHTTVDVKVDNGVAKHPALLMKVGNGSDTFANLPWMSAKAADVLSVCKNEADLKAFVNTVIGDAGIASDEAMQELAGRVTTAEGKVTTLEGEMDAAQAAILALEGLTGGEKVSEAINKAIRELNLADTYAAKTHGHEISEVNGLSDAIATAKKAGTDANTALETYKTTNDAAVKVVSDAVAGIKNGTTIDNFAEVEEALAGKQAAGNYSVVGHKHEIADVNGLSDAIADAKKAGTDASAAAAQALVDAKAYTDGFTGGKTVAQSINDTIKDYSTTAQMNTAIATAKGEAVEHANGLNTAMDARVKVVEGKAHTHTFVESELNLIKAGDVAKWNAAEQNAKDYADGLDEAMDTRVLALEAKFGTGEGNVEAQISAAVAAEAKLREDADKDLQGQIGAASADGAPATGLHARIEALEGLTGGVKVSDAILAEENRAKGVESGLDTRLQAIEGDYLKAADKTELEGKIKSNTDAIALLTNGADPDVVDGVNDLIAYVAEHGTEVTGIKASIKANADAIGKATEGETAGTGLYKRIEDAEDAIALKATQADLESLDDRVEVVESELNTAETGLKARMTAAEGDVSALYGLIGDGSVSSQIEKALRPNEVEKYALATDLTGAITQHNTDKAALEADIAKKANAADLAAIAFSGSTDDLIQGQFVLLFDCGGAGV